MNKKSVARRHHYLPQSYLALFTDKGTKEGQFFVQDVTTGDTFRTSPLNVAVEQDFNRVDIDGYPSDIIEKELGKIEDKAVQAIANIIATENFPNDEDYYFILRLICLIAVRNPFLRKCLNRAREQEINILGDLLVSNKNIWENYVRKAKENGASIPDNISFEDMKNFIEGRKYQIRFIPEGNLWIELSTFERILPILGERYWSLIIAPQDGPEFICSDHPVTVNWKYSSKGLIGFGLRETEVFFPLSRRLGFYGTFEDPLEKVVHIGPEKIALMNQRVVFNADRHIYSQLESFIMWTDSGIKTINCRNYHSNATNS